MRGLPYQVQPHRSLRTLPPRAPWTPNLPGLQTSASHSNSLYLLPILHSSTPLFKHPASTCLCHLCCSSHLASILFLEMGFAAASFLFSLPNATSVLSQGHANLQRAITLMSYHFLTSIPVSHLAMEPLDSQPFIDSENLFYIQEKPFICFKHGILALY